MPKVLIVEDEASLADTVAYNLREEGYKACIAADGISALDLLRRESDVPIIMLTAKSREIDKVVGLEVGADDYVTKPFGMMELVARVRAALRRSRSETRSAEVLSGHDVELDTSRHSVKVDGVEVNLRPKEFDLLHLLMSNRGRVFERSTLLDRIWGEDEFIDAGTVDVHIRRLREKVEADPSRPKRVLTVRGIGYKFAE